MNELPEDVIIMIIKDLSLDDIKCLRCTNKRLLEISDDYITRTKVIHGERAISLSIDINIRRILRSLTIIYNKLSLKNAYR